MKRFLTVLMIPYVTTMAWTGRIGGGDFTGFEELAGAGGEGSQGGSLGTDGNGVAGRRYVAVEREGKVSRVPAEDFLVHVLAAQIPADFGPETLKAQAVIARTYIYREMDGAEEIPEEALDMDALSGAQMEELWGGTYQEDYSRIREAVSATSGLQGPEDRSIHVSGRRKAQGIFWPTDICPLRSLRRRTWPGG